jgi:hypothetical protein
LTFLSTLTQKIPETEEKNLKQLLETNSNSVQSCYVVDVEKLKPLLSSSQLTMVKELNLTTVRTANLKHLLNLKRHQKISLISRAILRRMQKVQRSSNCYECRQPLTLGELYYSTNNTACRSKWYHIQCARSKNII